MMVSYRLDRITKDLYPCELTDPCISEAIEAVRGKKEVIRLSEPTEMICRPIEKEGGHYARAWRNPGRRVVDLDTNSLFPSEQEAGALEEDIEDVPF